MKALLLAAALAAAADTQFQLVVVKPGDTLWAIANKYLMDPSKWDEIVKHNRLPSSDPTVALPGMTLKVPVRLIKKQLRAAHITYVFNRVDFRRAETADWRKAAEEGEVFQGDSVRTLDSSKAKVRFLNAELLSLDANSLAIIKPQDVDADVELKSGGVFVGRSRVVTATARVTPKTKDTQYSARVAKDFTTLVEVYKGLAAVQAQGQTVDVRAGMATEVRPGLAPGVPQKIADLPEFEARASDFQAAVAAAGGGAKVSIAAPNLALSATSADLDMAKDVDTLRSQMKQLAVGMPVAGYRIQASRSREFDSVLYDKTLEAEERLNLKSALPPGVYWWRVAVIDLLGAEGSFSAPKLYGVGMAQQAKVAGELDNAVALASPREGEVFTSADLRVVGVAKYDGLTVSVNDRPARVDEAGNFSAMVRLSPGANAVVVSVSDGAKTGSVTRRVTYKPAAP